MGKKSNNQRLLSIREAAEFLGVGIWTMRRLIWNGTVPRCRFNGRVIRVDLVDLERLIDETKEAGGEPNFGPSTAQAKRHLVAGKAG